MFRSLLIPTDLSPNSDRAIQRAALLPLAKGARLTLLHVVPRLLPKGAKRRAHDDARKALGAAAKALDRTLRGAAAVRVAIKDGAPAAEIARQAGADKAELIVMGRRGGALRDTVLGSTAERVIRRGQRPVLVVRLSPHAPYRRPVLALDLDRVARDAIGMLLRVVPPPRPPVSLIHAYDAPLQGLVYTSVSTEEAEEYRGYYRQKALHGLNQLVAGSLEHARAHGDGGFSWKAHVRYGSPRSVIEQAVEKSGADLLAIGTHGYAAVAHAFLGTVAGDVLRAVPCDVLVVPPRHEGARIP